MLTLPSLDVLSFCASPKYRTKCAHSYLCAASFFHYHSGGRLFIGQKLIISACSSWLHMLQQLIFHLFKEVQNHSCMRSKYKSKRNDTWMHSHIFTVKSGYCGFFQASLPYVSSVVVSCIITCSHLVWRQVLPDWKRLH